LNGLSKLPSAVKSAPKKPSAAGRSNEKRNGRAMKNAIEISCTASSRCACRSSSRRVVQTKIERQYKRSIDQYGTIVHGTKGMERSQSNATAPTSPRRLASQFANP
jgi:hypothetical protein